MIQLPKINPLATSSKDNQPYSPERSFHFATSVETCYERYVINDTAVPTLCSAHATDPKSATKWGISRYLHLRMCDLRYHTY